MKRILIVYNPRSSRYEEVKAGVIDRARKLKGCMVGKYEIQKIGIEGNVERLAGILKDGDIVVSAGGDATGVISANAIMQSGKDAVLAALPYGNFNDLARTLGAKKFDDIIGGCKTQDIYPLEVMVDGKFWRYATCYTTIGMTAEVVKTFDQPKVRRILKTSSGRTFGSYFHLAGWYFKNRHKAVFLPKFSLNGIEQEKGVSDYLAMNGKSMARVMKGRGDLAKPHMFQSHAVRLTSFWRLFKFMIQSMLSKMPGNDTTGDVLDFAVPVKIEIQAEGESRAFTDVKKVEIKKASRSLKVVVRR